ncbi:tyrosine-type recombinase/integrase [Janthinobacterium sp. HLS12-2]|uniref:tyrosine-type recombinase/integrase n=1 Tax=Janthinobacterium sp. HLS12-2 TaxID=1259324 RepID=UPI003F243B70
MGKSREELETRAGRLVDLRSGAVNALLAQKLHRLLAGGLVFLDPATGQGWDNTQRLTLFWTAMIEKAQVRYRNPYQTRHTFASPLLTTGANAMYVAKQMGHTDTTIRTYGHWLEQEGGVLPDHYCDLTDGLKARGA